jgi:hypothetical protein
LYSPTDQAKAKLRIVGDPAWMQQGEVAGGVSARNFNFDPFNSDGTINYDSQEVVFDISWNQPADYDLDTGLMDLKRTGIKPDGTYSTQPQLNFTYTAIKCKNIFSKGRFEQDIEGRLLIEFEKNPASADAGRPSSNAPTTANGTRNNTNGSANDWVDVNGLQVLKSDVTADGDSNQSDSAPQLLNSPPPAAPTSDGDIVPTTSVPSPSTADIANSPNDGVKEKLALAASYEERAAAARAAGELSNAATLARLAQNSRENAAADAKFGAPPVISNPQKINRETYWQKMYNAVEVGRKDTSLIVAAHLRKWVHTLVSWSTTLTTPVVVVYRFTLSSLEPLPKMACPISLIPHCGAQSAIVHLSMEPHQKVAPVME